MDDREKEEDSDSHVIIGSWGVIVRETVNFRLTLKDLLRSSNICHFRVHQDPWFGCNGAVVTSGRVRYQQ
jgi:hypothetical protein